MTNLFNAFMWPSTKLGKFIRDGLIMTATTAVGYLINNWAGFVDAVNSATGDKIPAVLLAWAFSGALYAARWLRERTP